MRNGLIAPIVVLAALTGADRTSAQSPTPSAEEFAGLIQGLLVNHLPKPLVNTQSNWGKQVEAVFGDKKRNHGAWRSLNISAMSPEKTLHVTVQNLVQPEPSRTTFDMQVVVDTQFEFRQQIWERGLRVYAGSSVARAKAVMTLQCEIQARSEPGPGRFPDLIFRLRVLKAELGYKDLDFVRVGAVKGDGADVLGHAMVSFLKTVKPSLEKDLLAKANAAIIKAGDTKEIRISLGKMFGR